jgi:SAM-dependent methyltransferase
LTTGPSMAERILNVGCDLDTYGTDFVDAFPAVPGTIRCDVDSERLPFKDGTFDEVYSKNLLEHLRNPGRALDEMVRVLKEGGRLVIVTDNANYWLWSVLPTHQGGYEKRRLSVSGITGDRHYSLFTDWHLRNHLEKAGNRRMRNIVVSLEALGAFPTAKMLIPSAINLMLSVTPLRRLAYYRLRAEAIKWRIS